MVKVFEVGGSIRDELLDLPVKDCDFAVEHPDGFEGMRKFLEDLGFKIYISNPEFLTVRAKAPGNTVFSMESRGSNVCDFVLCRKDGPSLDSRHPDSVEPGTILDDLARRDFTINAMARQVFPTLSYSLLDPHGGLDDIEEMVLRFVGDPMTRIREDGLRSLRAIRFAVTKDLTIHMDTWDAINALEAKILLAGTSNERKREELLKAFAYNTPRTMKFLYESKLMAAVFNSTSPLWLEPTLRKP